MQERLLCCMLLLNVIHQGFDLMLPADAPMTKATEQSKAAALWQ
jgi:hypothetical protein